MSELSYEKMLEMQDEAKQRVMEMQKRSRDVIKQFGDYRNSGGDENDLPQVPKAISLPVEIPGREKSADKNEEQGRGLLSSVLSGDDADRMLIMALCLLLKNENCDRSLILALMYLLT